MPQIVLIDTGTYKPGTNEVGDFVALHEDDVDLKGGAYASFRVLPVAGLTVQEIKAGLQVLIPEIATAYSADKPAGTWTLTEPQTRRVWKDSLTWRFLDKMPKYLLNFSPLSASDLTMLEDADSTRLAKTAILKKVKSQIASDSLNSTEAADLNG
jgi:hypothetical protein